MFEKSTAIQSLKSMAIQGLKATAIQSLPFYGSLTIEQKELLMDQSEIRTYKKGEEITCLMSPCVGPFLILEGEVRAVLEDEENSREITLFELRANEMGILSAACVLEHITFDAKFIVERKSLLLALHSCAVKKIMEENVEVRCAVFEMLADRFSLCMATLHDVLFTRYEKRVAAFLVEKYIYTGKTEFRITQEEIAKNTSSVREVAGRTIRQFAKDGLLEYGRGTIKLLDVKKLKKMM